MEISDFFSKKKTPAVSYESYYSIDIHSHIIPGIDDGAQTIEESLEIIAFFQSIGIKKIITTPHISGSYPNTNDIILSGYSQLKNKLIEINPDIDLHVAAEYMVDESFTNIIKQKKLLCFGKNFILIEFPYFSTHPDIHNVIFSLQSDGFSIIIAHPERYVFWGDTLNTFKKLKERGVFFQMNLLSLTSIYSEEIQKNAHWLIKNQLIDFVGSDIHHISAAPYIKNVLKEKLFFKMIETNQIKNNALLT